MAAIETIRKQSGSSVLVFDPRGSRFTWSVEGIPILGSFTRGDGSEGVSHSAIPVFDEDPEGKIKRHGMTRDRDFVTEVTAETDNSITTRAVLTYGDPKSRLLVIQTYTINQTAEHDSFELATDVRNIGRARLPELSGVHPYFNAPWGRANVVFNEKCISKLMEDDGIVDTRQQNVLFIPGLIPNNGKLYITQHDLPKANAWVGQNEQGEFDKYYFALSFVSDNFRDSKTSFRSKKRMMRPGESRHTSLTISTGG